MSIAAPPPSSAPPAHASVQAISLHHNDAGVPATAQHRADTSFADREQPPITLARRRALTNQNATAYARADKTEKGQILDRICAETGWHRSHARRALTSATGPKPIPAPRQNYKYSARHVSALTQCWTILDQPAGKRLAPVLPELLSVLRNHNELDLDDDDIELLSGMSAATIDRRLTSARRREQATPRRIRPGSLIRGELPIVTWIDWDDNTPGFVELTVLDHNAERARHSGPHTITVTDICTGWTENRTIHSIQHIRSTLGHITNTLPFPLMGIDVANAGTVAADVALEWSDRHRISATLTRPSKDGANSHVGQRNWIYVQELTADLSFSAPHDVRLLNKIWTHQSTLSNYFHPQQKSSKAVGSRTCHDIATPYRRVREHRGVSVEDKAILDDVYATINPASLYRQRNSLIEELRRSTDKNAQHSRTDDSSSCNHAC